MTTVYVVGSIAVYLLVGLLFVRLDQRLATGEAHNIEIEAVENTLFFIFFWPIFLLAGLGMILVWVIALLCGGMVDILRSIYKLVKDFLPRGIR